MKTTEGGRSWRNPVFYLLLAGTAFQLLSGAWTLLDPTFGLIWRSLVLGHPWIGYGLGGVLLVYGFIHIAQVGKPQDLLLVVALGLVGRGIFLAIDRLELVWFSFPVTLILLEALAWLTRRLIQDRYGGELRGLTAAAAMGVLFGLLCAVSGAGAGLIIRGGS